MFISEILDPVGVCTRDDEMTAIYYEVIHLENLHVHSQIKNIFRAILWMSRSQLKTFLDFSFCNN